MANTGIKNVLTLRKYLNGVATSEVKPNTVGDPDYIAPYEDLTDCPVTTTTTTTTTTTAAPTTTTAAPTTTTQAPLYYRFENCATQELVFQTFATSPTVGGRYTDGVSFFVRDSSEPTTQPGTIVTNLSGPIGTGCPS